MAERYFNVVTGGNAIFNGRQALKTVAGSIYNGYLIALEATTGSAVVSTGSPMGMLYDFLVDAELPATDNVMTYKAGKLVNVVNQGFEAVLGKDLFKQGALPANGAKLYDGGAGKVDTVLVGTNACIGRVLDNSLVLTTPDGTVTLARCQFDFTAVI
jgi:hypothetical protein